MNIQPCWVSESFARDILLSEALDLCADLADGKGADTADVIAARAEVTRIRGRAAVPPAERVPASVG